MNNERITLTMKEQRTNDILVKLINHEITINDTSRLTGLSERQIYRKKKNYLQEGISSILHKNRGKSTGRGYSQELKQSIINLYQEEYLGWNFHHFNDTLEDFHSIKVSDSYIYNLLTDYGYESPLKYKSKKKVSHPPRQRKEKAGELLQVDASKHKWFDGNDNFYHLHGAIDDSTGIVTGCFFEKQETTHGYQMILKDTIKNYGIPEFLYTDYRTVFKSNKKYLTLDEELKGKKIKNTRFSNMCQHLGTGILSTTSPQAKGKIERLWKTFQNRLYNELKKKGIHNCEEANLYLNNIFLPKYNARFALPLDNNKNNFVCPPQNFNYNIELGIWSEHKVYHNSYLKYNNLYHIILKDNQKTYLKTSKSVKVYTFLDGTEHILFNDTWYNLKTVKDFQVNLKKSVSIPKSQEQINKSKSHKPSNSPWRNGNLPYVSKNSMAYAYFNGC